MFDSCSGSRHPTADAVRDTARSLSAALGEPSGLDDAARVDTIRAYEEFVCVLTAAQAALTVELDESQRDEQAARGVPSAQQGRGVAAQVALARRVSAHRGQRYLGLAKIVASELPHTWAAWSAGLITEWRATLVARETACLSREDRLAVDAAVAACPDSLEAMGDRELVMACQREAYGLDPESYVTRRRKAEADRNVTLRPAPDAMAWLTALLPVKDAVGAYAALARGADSARAVGDPRSRGQVMADTLVQSVLAAAAGRDDAQARWEPAATPSPEADSGGLALGLVMSDTALFGTSDEPAHLDGYGPIPAELAREIVVGACRREEQWWLTRLYTSPRTGELVAMDSKSRRFRNSLARFIRLRDRICRTPWCDAPIRHTDHPHGASSGGETSAGNGQGLCEACNYAKEAVGWSARGAPDDGHTVRTTTPTGHTYTSRAPRLATVRQTPFVIDWVLAS